MSTAAVRPPPSDVGERVQTSVEIAIRLGAIALLVAGCLVIVAPFASIVVWGAIIAIAAEKPFEALCRAVSGRRNLAATMAVLVSLVLLLVPVGLLFETLIGGAQGLAERVGSGTLQVPAPPESVASWPVVGGRLYALWKAAAQDLASTLAPLAPQLRPVGHWLLQAGASAVLQVLLVVGSLVVAGVMLAHSAGLQAAITRFATRLAGAERGSELAGLANATVQSVVQGIVGVAFIQAILAGAGLLAADIPAAGLWALLVLIAAVIQLPVGLVLITPIVLAFTSLGTVAASLFTAWCVLIALLDNVLKPLLFGRGVRAPALVIFVGALGGMLAFGILGLFIGAVVLVLGYELFVAWLAGPAR
jgi:predicted PurR-regulated permease PerM